MADTPTAADLERWIIGDRPEREPDELPTTVAEWRAEVRRAKAEIDGWLVREVRGHHANHRIRPIIQRDRLSDDIGRSA